MYAPAVLPLPWLRARLDRRRHEDGLALLDVLLGMAIFALIAVIAAQAFGMFRDRAYVTQAVSDARQVGTGLAAHLTEPNVNVDDVPTGTLSRSQLVDLGLNLTSGSTAVVERSGDHFDICVQNDHAFAWWRAEKAAVADFGYIPDDGGCGASAAPPGGTPGGSDDENWDPNTPIGSPPDCGELSIPAWEPGREASTAVYPVMGAVSYVSALPWEAGHTSGDWWGGWWHEGDPEAYEVREVSPGDWAVFHNGSLTYLVPADATTFLLPWEAGHTKDSWLGVYEDWWPEDGRNLNDFTLNDDGEILDRGTPVTVEYSWPREEGYWFCDQNQT